MLVSRLCCWNQWKTNLGITGDDDDDGDQIPDEEEDDDEDGIANEGLNLFEKQYVLSSLTH